MKVVVVLKTGRSETFDNASIVPPSMATPYYLVNQLGTQDRLDYFSWDGVEQVTYMGEAYEAKPGQATERTSLKSAYPGRDQAFGRSSD